MQRLTEIIREVLENSRTGKVIDEIGSSKLGKNILEGYYSQKGHWSTFEGEIRKTSYKKDNGDILFPVEGVFRSTIRSLILARKFEMRGYNPVFVTHCGLDHPIYIYPKVGNIKFRNFLKDKRRISDCELIKKLGYELIEIDPETRVNEIEEESIIEDNALSCTKKHFRRYNLDLNDDSVRSSYERFKQSGRKIFSTLEQIDKERDIEVIIVHDPAYMNGIYGSFGVKNDISSYSVSWAWNQQKVLIGNFENRNPLGQFTKKEVLENIMEEDASDDEIKSAEKVIENRSQGKNLRSNHKEFSSEDSKIDFAGEGVVYSLFTNLLWDASLEADDVAFKSPFSWLEETIEFFKNKESKKLVIKTHPAEEKRLTDEKVFEWIQENYDLDEIDNIDVLSPKTDIDPYDLMSSTDVGIVYNSTTGMEMASQDIPVIVVGDTHYRGLGFTVEPSDAKEYKEKLSKDLSDLKKNPRKAKKYINFLFNRKQIDFQYIKENGTEFKKIRDEDIRNDESLDLIVEKVLNGEEVFYPE
jgi:hypothetical protein